MLTSNFIDSMYVCMSRKSAGTFDKTLHNAFSRFFVSACDFKILLCSFRHNAISYSELLKLHFFCAFQNTALPTFVDVNSYWPTPN